MRRLTTIIAACALPLLGVLILTDSPLPGGHNRGILQTHNKGAQLETIRTTPDVFFDNDTAEEEINVHGAPVVLDELAGDFFYSPSGQQRLIRTEVEQDVHLLFWIQCDKAIFQGQRIDPLLDGLTMRWRGDGNASLQRELVLSTAVKTMHVPAMGDLEVNYTPNLYKGQARQPFSNTHLPARACCALALSPYVPSERAPIAIPVPGVLIGSINNEDLPKGARYVTLSAPPLLYGFRVWLKNDVATAFPQGQLLGATITNEQGGEDHRIDASMFTRLQVVRVGNPVIPPDFPALMLRVWV